MVRLGYVRGSVGNFELPDSPCWQDLIVCVHAYYIGGPDTLLRPLVVSIITPLYVIFGAPFLTNISRSIGQLAAISMIGLGQSRHYIQNPFAGNHGSCWLTSRGPLVHSFMQGLWNFGLPCIDWVEKVSWNMS